MIVSTFIKYLSGKKCHFFMTPDQENDKHEIVVLAHGLIRRSLNFYVMGKYLRKAGYTVYIYDYQTTVKSITEHGKDFKLYLEKIAKENPPEIPINLVTHSMGGIITRIALAHLANDEVPADEILTRKRFKRIVMLAPPHHGSDAARRVVKYLPFTKSKFKPLPELSSAPDSFIHSVPVPKGLEIGVIAGRFDFEVSLPYTYLKTQKDHIVLLSDHSFIMYLPNVKRAVLRFLETGSF